MKYSTFILGSLLLFGVTACEVPDLESAQIELDPINVAVPVGTISFDEIEKVVTMKDFTSSFSKVQVNSTLNGVTTPEGKDVTIPEQSSNVTLNLSSEPGFTVSEVLLEEGTLDLKFVYSFNSETHIRLVIPELTNAQGAGFDATYVLPKGNQTVIKTIDLSNYKIAASNNVIQVKTSGVIKVKSGDVLGSAEITPSLTIAGLKFKHVKGNFGQKTVEVDPESFEISDALNDNSNIGQGDVVLKLNFENGFGVPFSLDFSKIKAIKKDNSTVTLNYTGNSKIASAQLSGTQLTPGASAIEINGSNSNIKSLLAPDVKEIIFGISIQTNPDNLTGNQNFITNDGKIKVSIGVKAPVQIKIGSN